MIVRLRLAIRTNNEHTGVMTAPYQTVCACGRTIVRRWPPCDADLLCDRCEGAASERAAKAELGLCFVERAGSDGPVNGPERMAI
jgi:hypothetical protein